MLKKFIIFTILQLFIPSLIWGDDNKSLAIIVNSSLEIENLDPEHLADIFRGKVDYWPDGQKVFVINRPFTSKERELFYSQILRVKPTHKFFKSGSPLPIKTMVTKSSLATLKMVERIPNSISYVFLSDIKKQKVKILRIKNSLPGTEGYILNVASTK